MSLFRDQAALLACLIFLPSLATQAAPAKIVSRPTSGISVMRLTWHGWPDSLRISNGLVEAIVVPAIGRIMAFEFVGHPETDPIFVNKDWEGKTVADASPTDWAAFGGDKLWPSPQSDWAQHNIRAWPPDQTFDGDPENAQILPNGVRLTTPGSTAFAVRAVREITLKPGQARLYIAQRLRKDSDAADKRDGFPIGIWSITQTRGDGLVFLPLSATSRFANGYTGLDLPAATYPAPYFSIHAGLLRVLHGLKEGRKIGVDNSADWLASLYDGTTLFSEHFVSQPGGAYPDGGASSEVYVNPGPAYLEMEMLGPMMPLTHGNGMSYPVYWQLQRLPHIPQSRTEAEILVKAAMEK